MASYNPFHFNGASFPNVNSTWMDQNQHNFSGLEASDNSYELMPFPNDLPSQMGGEQSFSLINIPSSSSFISPYLTYNHAINGVVPFSNEKPPLMGGEQSFSPLNNPLSSSFISPYLTYNHGFNGVVPFYNEMPSETGFMQTARGLTEDENLNGLTTIPSDMSVEEGFAQRSSSLPQLSFNGYEPFGNEMPSTSDRVDIPPIKRDVHFSDLDADFFDVEEEINRKSFSGVEPSQDDIPLLEVDYDYTEEMDQMLALSDNQLNKGKTVASNTFEPQLNFKLTLQRVNNGVFYTFGARDTSNENVKPFGKNGLTLVKLPTTKPRTVQRFKRSKTVDCYDAKFEISESCRSSIRMVNKAEDGSQLEELEEVSKRLNGWTMEKRKRDTGTLDKFYRHNSSKRNFRSVTEELCKNYRR